MENKQYKFPMFFTFDWVLSSRSSSNVMDGDSVDVLDFKKDYLDKGILRIETESDFPYECRQIIEADQKSAAFAKYGIRLPFDTLQEREFYEGELNYFYSHTFVEPKNQETEDGLFLEKLIQIHGIYLYTDLIYNQELTAFLNFQFIGFSEKGETTEYLNHLEVLLHKFNSNKPKEIILRQVLIDWINQKREKLIIQGIEPSPQPKPLNSKAFFILIYFLGRLGIVQSFKIQDRTNRNKEMIRIAAETAMREFGGEYNLETLQKYPTIIDLTDINIRKKYIPKILEIIVNKYPASKDDITGILNEFKRH
jgi:hypothetical protein